MASARLAVEATAAAAAGSPTSGYVAAYAPLGSWSEYQTGVALVLIAGALPPELNPGVIETADVVNSCSEVPPGTFIPDSPNPEAVCVANGTDIYLVDGLTVVQVLTSGGTGSASFTGGLCTTCGVVVDPLSQTAVIAVSSSSGGGGYQLLDLTNPTQAGLSSVIDAAPNGIAETAGILPIAEDQLLILSPTENNAYDVFDVQIPMASAADVIGLHYGAATGGNELDSAAAGATGIVLATDEFTGNVFLADLTQASIALPSVPGSFGSWTAPAQLQNMPALQFPSAGTSAIATAYGAGVAVLADEFGTTAFGAIRLPSAPGSGVPAVSDWVAADMPADPSGAEWAMPLDPHGLVAAFASARLSAGSLIVGPGGGIGLLENKARTYVAVIDLLALLSAPRSATDPHRIEPTFDLLANNVVAFAPFPNRSSSPSVPTGISNFSDGELLQDSSGALWIVYGGAPFPISAAQFSQMQFDPNLVETFSGTLGFQLPEPGTVLQEFDSALPLSPATVYMIEGVCDPAGTPCTTSAECYGAACTPTMKRRIPDYETFVGLEYAVTDIGIVPDGTLAAIPSGPDVPSNSTWLTPVASHYCVDASYKLTSPLQDVSVGTGDPIFFDPLSLLDPTTPCRRLRGFGRRVENPCQSNGDDGDFNVDIQPDCGSFPYAVGEAQCFAHWWFGLGPSVGNGEGCQPTPDGVANCRLHVEVNSANQPLGTIDECGCAMEGCGCALQAGMCGCTSVRPCEPPSRAFGNRWSIGLRSGLQGFEQQPVEIIGAMVTDNKHEGLCDTAGWPEIHPVWRVRFLHDATRAYAADSFDAGQVAQEPEHTCQVKCCSGAPVPDGAVLSREECLAYAFDGCIPGGCAGVQEVDMDGAKIDDYESGVRDHACESRGSLGPIPVLPTCHESCG
jgi:hypothetical protein